MKKLGFGCMRLPITDQNNQISVDFQQFCDMVDSFIEQGFTYFDTAYMYHDFTLEEGTGPVLLGEVSMCNDDENDNRFYEEMPRFPAIEEDEKPYRLLCTEYPEAR